MTHAQPQAIETERSVIGACLQNEEALHTAMEQLIYTDFFDAKNQKVFKAMSDLYFANTAVDLTTVPNKLGRQLEGVGGRAYLMTMMESVVVIHIEDWCAIVKDKSMLRQLIGIDTETIERAYLPDADGKELIELQEQKLFKLSEGTKSDIVHIKTFGAKVYDNLNNRVMGLSCGLSDVDNLTSGFQDSELIIIAGRPSTGKTAFAVNIIEHVAVGLHLPIMLFSLEMSKEQIAERLLYSRARVPSARGRNGKSFGDGELTRLASASGQVNNAPIYIDDSGALSVMEIRGRTRKAKMKYDIKVAFVDYLQLVRGQKNPESRNQEVTFISGQLKAMAKELKIPVIALSQLSRKIDGRGKDAKPQLSDLRESGAIEQDADLVLFVHARETIIIGKARNGPLGEIPVVFHGEYTKFDMADRIHTI